MTQNSQQIRIRARFDKPLVPAGRSVCRNLLVEILAPELVDGTSRPPLNLSFVIDRSGSMGGARLDAAKRAVAGVADSLQHSDRLSLVVFDNEARVICRGLPMDDGGKRQLQMGLADVRPGGCTNLAAGWYEGARCATAAMEQNGFSSGHVVVLSDGRANRGICGPAELELHARALAERGITTSAVGIGATYSPLQLDALAQGGRGRLHDTEFASDIVNVILGESNALGAIIARDATLTVNCPADIRARVISRSPDRAAEESRTAYVGDIVADSEHPIAIGLDLPALPAGERIPIELELHWRETDGDNTRASTVAVAELTVVPPEEAANQHCDLAAAAKIADLWEGALAYAALLHNERRDYDSASQTYQENSRDYQNLVRELPDAAQRISRYDRAGRKCSRRWDGRSKRQAIVQSKKAMLAEPDFRGKRQDDLFDHLAD